MVKQRCSQDKTSKSRLFLPQLSANLVTYRHEGLSHEMTKPAVMAVIQPGFGQGLHLAILSWQERLCKKLRLQVKKWWHLTPPSQNHS